ncbi:MAG: hypothetical protein LBB85_09650 [Dysgonamonadaceae bacterium]|jgi:hypothetical protein|nr:hypothetical protein [Dysgonamonadaceae bacterium]
MEKKMKKNYLPPKVEVREVILEECIAGTASSGVSTQLSPWENDEVVDGALDESGDIYIIWD